MMSSMGLLSTVFLAAAIAASPSQGPADCLERFDHLDRTIREGTIEPGRARKLMISLHADLRDRFPLQRAGAPVPRIFPVAGYGARDIGGKHGSGFVPRGYRYYDGPRHGGHPAHDIFVRDGDHDSLDDSTGRPVAVLAFAGGWVVGVEKDWRPGSATRGGNHVWILGDTSDTYYCFSHLGPVAVSPGQRVIAGDRLGSVGRTGRNALPRRSPTHLHFMALAFDGGVMRPVDTYRDLLSARRNSPPRD